MFTWMTAKRWLLRRLSLILELSRHFLPRQSSRRLAFVGCAISVLFIYTVLFGWPGPNIYNSKQPTTEHCVIDHMIRKGISHPLVNGQAEGVGYWRENRVAFAGNGFLGIDMTTDRRLILLANESGRAHLHTGFHPLVDVQMPLASQQDSVLFADPVDGVARSVHCSKVADKCVCISQTVYAHRTRPELLVQDVHIINPSTSSFSVTFARRRSTDWEEHKQSTASSPPVFTKLFSLGGKNLLVAVQCSAAIPTKTVAIRPKVEESFRFICAVDTGGGATVAAPTDNPNGGAGNAAARGAAAHASASVVQATVTRLSATFARLYAFNSDHLDQEHAMAWKELNSATFHISHSKAPNALNQAQIDTVRHALLSTVRATLLENGTGTITTPTKTTNMADQQRQQIAQRWASVVRNSAQCYAGHSTLLTPSKLWQRWDDLRTALKTLDIWRMTLEHRGCSRLVRGPTGAHGVVQAFLLSLSAATFTASSPSVAGGGHTLHQQKLNNNDIAVGGTTRLEIGLDPESELHRHIKVDGLLVGSSGAVRLSMDFQLDLSLKPFVSLRTYASNGGGAAAATKTASNSATPPPLLYACTAGCQEAPFQIGEKQISLAIKVTRPRTPIIFISEHADQLELVRKTLHVIEVVDAPAHEQHTVDLHKHGGSGGGGGLPTLFWVVLVLVLIAFHLFLLKLLYTEWKNASGGPGVPYSKYSKRVLFRRE